MQLTQQRGFRGMRQVLSWALARSPGPAHGRGRTMPVIINLWSARSVACQRIQPRMKELSQARTVSPALCNGLSASAMALS
ncbi:hypothetical protein CVT30_02645 [Streptomyces sp. AMCC400023]|nr:hypothetical protein CVT30_02645 [Streptomyces sp. AMCC400023]